MSKLHSDPWTARKVRIAEFYLRWGYPIPIDLQVALLERGIDVGELERNYEKRNTQDD